MAQMKFISTAFLCLSSLTQATSARYSPSHQHQQHYQSNGLDYAQAPPAHHHHAPAHANHTYNASYNTSHNASDAFPTLIKVELSGVVSDTEATYWRIKAIFEGDSIEAVGIMKLGNPALMWVGEVASLTTIGATPLVTGKESVDTMRAYLRGLIVFLIDMCKTAMPGWDFKTAAAGMLTPYTVADWRAGDLYFTLERNYPEEVDASNA